MKILITGSAGFIGFSFSRYLAKKYKRYEIICIDNINSFYSKKYKLKRITELKKYKNINFKKIDITSYGSLNKLFLKNKIDVIFNFAAQAGVRYSLTNPEKFINSNINGFFNILELSRKFGVKRLFYASSSSVYGDIKKFPTFESNNLKPINVYSLSKEFNENLSKIYFDLYGIQSIGLRFFTVYGEWGRPDMFLFKLFKSSLTNSKFELNNNGNHYRDFTYIEDINQILDKLLNKSTKPKNDIINICGGKSINIKDLVDLFKKENKLDIVYKTKHKADLLKTHGSNKKIIQKIGKFNFTKIENVLIKIFNWYKKNKIHLIT